MNIAVLGDVTSHVGVITPIQAAFTINGLAVITTGATCACTSPTHASVVAATGTFTVDGVPVATNGSLCACSATVLATTQLTVTVTP